MHRGGTVSSGVCNAPTNATLRPRTRRTPRRKDIWVRNSYAILLALFREARVGKLLLALKSSRTDGQTPEGTKEETASAQATPRLHLPQKLGRRHLSITGPNAASSLCCRLLKSDQEKGTYQHDTRAAACAGTQRLALLCKEGRSWQKRLRRLCVMTTKNGNEKRFEKRCPKL